MVVRFVWGGANMAPRQRIAHNVLILPKALGGLGLLTAKQQASAFAPATVTWAFSPGLPHPLKQLIRATFTHDAERMWGAPVEAALLHTGRRLTDRAAWDNTPIWDPQILAVRTKASIGKTQGHQMLQRRGITHLKHIADGAGRIKKLAEIDVTLNRNTRAKAAFQKIKNITPSFAECNTPTKTKNTYLLQTGTEERWCVAVLTNTANATVDPQQNPARQVYRIHAGGLLIKQKEPEIPPGTH
ncbi:hypothetical protein R1sor_008466 [Riccia sorocarpa]|uniref:Uncharacterized protein n=1 Tax=Riccia sorocarpa TaxID=122646 RepID=A0ABD3HTH8_9MARC